MKYLLILSVMILSSCSTINSELKNAISFGKIVDLSEYSESVEKNLFVRLYRSPTYQEECVKETHGVCQYQYFISVSTFDEYPETAIYKLNLQGEILKINWHETSQVDTAIIDFVFHSYTEMALESNPLLKSDEKKLSVKVNPISIEQSLAN